MQEVPMRRPVDRSDSADGLVLLSPFHPDLEDMARAAGGVWDPVQGGWVFDPAREHEVEAIYRSLFGDDGRAAVDLVALRCHFGAGASEKGRGIYVAGRCIARASAYASRARIGDHARFDRGSAYIGGQRSHWFTVIERDAVVVVGGVVRELGQANAKAPPYPELTIEILEPN